METNRPGYSNSTKNNDRIMEESLNLSIYAAPGIPYPIHMGGKRTIVKAIADAWNIPENRVLGNTDIIPKNHPSPNSARGEREKIEGERRVEYVNARKFYFYVMITLKNYRWKELTKLTGRKIAAMRYANRKAQEHMALEQDYMEKAQIVLDLINAELIIFPIRKIKLDATAINGGGISEGTPPIQVPEPGQRIFD
jgi:hypothetical protein